MLGQALVRQALTNRPLVTPGEFIVHHVDVSGTLTFAVIGSLSGNE